MRKAPSGTTSSMYYDTACAEDKFHKLSEDSQSGDENDDDFAQTYEGEESHRDYGTMAKVDNKYSSKGKIRKFHN